MTKRGYKIVECIECESQDCTPVPGAEGVYECWECGEFFEDWDYEEPQHGKKSREEDDR